MMTLASSWPLPYAASDILTNPTICGPRLRFEGNREVYTLEKRISALQVVENRTNAWLYFSLRQLIPDWKKFSGNFSVTQSAQYVEYR